jgi:folate-binding protein YgfZ
MSQSAHTQQHSDFFRVEQYNTARTVCGWQDISTVGKLMLTGADALDLLQRLTTNNLSSLHEGQGNQTVLLTEKARIVDVALVVHRGADILLMLTREETDTVRQWLKKYIVMDDVRVRDTTASISALRVFGPQSALLLNDCTGTDNRENPYFAPIRRTLFGVDCTIIKLHQFFEMHYMILCSTEHKEQIIEGFRSIESIAEINQTEYDVLRVEAGVGVIGHEWTDEHNPLEAQLVGLVDFKKGCYIGQEVIARLDTYNKVKVRLMGFSADHSIPVGGVFRDDSKDIGVITSSVYSPSLGKHIALGYIRTGFANPGTDISLYHNEKQFLVHIEKLPFVV